MKLLPTFRDVFSPPHDPYAIQLSNFCWNLVSAIDGKDLTSNVFCRPRYYCVISLCGWGLNPGKAREFFFLQRHSGIAFLHCFYASNEVLSLTKVKLITLFHLLLTWRIHGVVSTASIRLERDLVDKRFEVSVRNHICCLFHVNATVQVPSLTVRILIRCSKYTWGWLSLTDFVSSIFYVVRVKVKVSVCTQWRPVGEWRFSSAFA
jgi:hypothetical protein